MRPDLGLKGCQVPVFEPAVKTRSHVPLIIGAAILFATLLAIFGIFRLVDAQRGFELQRWQTRLGGAAQGMAGVAQEWIEERRTALANAATNPTVQIYLSELALADFDQARIEAGETKRGFVGSYIASLAQHAPFDGKADIALVAGNGVIVASSAGFAPSAKDFGSQPGLAAIEADGRAFAQVVVPVPSVMPGMAAVGHMLGRVPLDVTLQAALKDRNGFASGYAFLDVTEKGVRLLGEDGEWRMLDANASVDAVLIAVAETPNRLAEGVSRVTGAPQLMFAAPMAGSPFVVVSMIDRDAALGGVRERLQSLLLSLLFALAAAIAIVFALFAINRASEAAKEKDRKARFYWGLTDLLLDAIDQRDPGAAAHSRRVSALSAQLMQTLAASRDEIETAEIAGALLNVGKLFVPSDVLTKSGALDQEERGQLSSGSEKWLSLLSNVPFDLPIAPTLAQAHALMQGRRRVDETSSLAARVIVVANGFVALVSPRTYREPNSSEDAIALLAGLPSMDAQIVDALNDITIR